MTASVELQGQLGSDERLTNDATSPNKPAAPGHPFLQPPAAQRQRHQWQRRFMVHPNPGR